MFTTVHTLLFTHRRSHVAGHGCASHIHQGFVLVLPTSKCSSSSPSLHPPGARPHPPPRAVSAHARRQRVPCAAASSAQQPAWCGAAAHMWTCGATDGIQRRGGQKSGEGGGGDGSGGGWRRSWRRKEDGGGGGKWWWW
eukprot:354519-Chlamydomonas_euryale.AAC.8